MRVRSDGDIKARKRASDGDIKARKCAARRQEEQKRRRDRRSVMLHVLTSMACTKKRLETISVDRALACPSLRFADDDWNNRPPAPHQSTLGKDSINQTLQKTFVAMYRNSRVNRMLLLLLSVITRKSNYNRLVKHFRVVSIIPPKNT